MNARPPASGICYLEQLAERRIAEAIERGELDDLPGRGLPLPLDDDE